MIYLIRHGETEANIKHVYCGSTDLPLSAQGIEKLKARAASLPAPLRSAGPASLRFIISGLERTRQTLQLLFGDVPYEVDPRFREIDFGIFEMRSYYELKDTPEYQEWITGDNESNVCPGGESGRQMEARVMEAFHELCESPGASGAVVISHGGVIAAIMANLFPSENRTRFDWQPAPGHGYALDLGTATFEQI